MDTRVWLPSIDRELWMPTPGALDLLRQSGFGYCMACTQEHEQVAPQSVGLPCTSCGEKHVHGTHFFGTLRAVAV